ncbi:MAG TPA: hypothetical protein VGR90_02850, partial [Acidimicrobiales bacterium]|nr:hypothetical protein [Acidimicrobiales bacterium]
ADSIGVPLLGSIPLDPSVAAGGDTGRPVVLAPEKDGTAGAGAAAAFRALAARVADEVLPVVELSGCTARMLDDIEAAVAAGGPDRD